MKSTIDDKDIELTLSEDFTNEDIRKVRDAMYHKYLKVGLEGLAREVDSEYEEMKKEFPQLGKARR